MLNFCACISLFNNNMQLVASRPQCRDQERSLLSCLARRCEDENRLHRLDNPIVWVSMHIHLEGHRCCFIREGEKKRMTALVSITVNLRSNPDSELHTTANDQGLPRGDTVETCIEIW